MTAINRQWLLRRWPRGLLHRDDLELTTGDTHVRPLKDGDIRVHNMLFRCAPTMRNWMAGPNRSLHHAMALNAPVQGHTVGRVVESRNGRYPVGTRVYVRSIWGDYDIIDAEQSVPKLIPEGMSAVESVGKYGISSLTAYFGLLSIGQPRAGETLVVSGAAGSVGSLAAQIGKIRGCRVIGIAGGEQKRAWLIENCGVDAAIDYKAEDVDAALEHHCPSGIDLFFDNVGGSILQAAVDHMAKFGRIVLCGQISQYNSGGPAIGFTNVMRLVYGSIRMQGFSVTDFADDTPVALRDIETWIASGGLVVRVDVRHGFENLPETFNALFDGSNNGVLLVAADDDAYALA